jgi:hypothetical protein
MQARLTAHMLDDIVSNLKSDSASRSQDKRTQGRVGLRGTLDVIPCSFSKESNKPMTVWVRDISVNGIGLLVSSRLDEGVEFIARFVRDGRPPLCILYKVRYCRRVSSDLMSVGASFDRVMPDANGEVATIGKPKRGLRAGKPAQANASIN